MHVRTGRRPFRGVEHAAVRDALLRLAPSVPRLLNQTPLKETIARGGPMGQLAMLARPQVETYRPCQLRATIQTRRDIEISEEMVIVSKETLN